MKRIAGLAAALVVAAAACSDSPTSPRDNPLVAKQPMSPEAKAALARSMGVDPTTTFSNSNRQYLQNGNQSNVATPQFWISQFGTNLNFGDDDCAFVAFNFQFTFFGQAATGVWVSSNGNVRFGSPLTMPTNCTSFSPTTLPSGADRIIAPLFYDLVGSGANNVYFRVVGSPPNRRFVVTWLNMAAFSFGGNNTYQLQLLERLNVILFLYNGLNPPRAVNWTGTPLTAGVASGIAGGFGGFPGFLITATGNGVLTLDGHSFCLLNLGGSYRQYSDLICSLFVF